MDSNYSSLSTVAVLAFAAHLVVLEPMRRSEYAAASADIDELVRLDLDKFPVHTAMPSFKVPFMGATQTGRYEDETLGSIFEKSRATGFGVKIERTYTSPDGTLRCTYKAGSEHLWGFVGQIRSSNEASTECETLRPEGADLPAGPSA